MAPNMIVNTMAMITHAEWRREFLRISFISVGCKKYEYHKR